MNRATALLLATVCLLSAGSAARGDAISYNFSPNATQIFFNGTLSAARLMYSSGTAPSTQGTISTYVVAASMAPSSMPQSISMPIDLTLSSGTSSTTVQVGTLSGLLWHNGSALTYTSDITSTSIRDAGGYVHDYTFSSPSFIQASGLGFTVGMLTLTATDPILPPPTTPGVSAVPPIGVAAPEPSSFLLAGIGVPLLGIFLRRRRRA